MPSDTYYIIIIAGLCLFVLLFLAAGAANRRWVSGSKDRKPRFITITNSKVYFSGNKMPMKRMERSVPKAVDEQTQPDIVKDNHDDRRTARREKLVTPVDFVKQGKLFKDLSADFSRTGMFLKTRNPDLFNIDDTLTLTFQMADGSHRKTMGCIVRKAQQGFGIQFAAA